MENPIENRKDTGVVQLQWDYVAKFRVPGSSHFRRKSSFHNATARCFQGTLKPKTLNPKPQPLNRTPTQQGFCTRIKQSHLVKEHVNISCLQRRSN